MSPTPGLKKKSDEIFARLTELDEQQEPPTAFELQKLKREAKALAKVDAAWSWVLQGMVAVLAEQPDEMRKCHEIALNIEPHDEELVRNYAVSLMKMGFVSEALKTIRIAYRLAEGHSGNLELLIDYSWEAGRIREALRHCHTWEKLNPAHIYRYKSFLEEGQRIYDSAGIEDDEAEYVRALSHSVLHENGIYRVQSGKGVHADEESEWCSWTVSLPRSVADVVELDMELIGRLVEANVSPMLGEHVVVRYQAGGANGGRRKRTSKPSETAVN